MWVAAFKAAAQPAFGDSGSGQVHYGRYAGNAFRIELAIAGIPKKALGSLDGVELTGPGGQEINFDPLFQAGADQFTSD